MFRIPWVYFGSIIFLVHLGAFAFQLQSGRYMLKDSEEYRLAAENLMQHGVLYAGVWEKPYREDFFTKRPPVYPMLIGLLGGYMGTPWLILLLQNLLSLFNLWMALQVGLLLLHAAGRPTELRKVPIGVVILTLCYPAQWIYANLMMTEMLFQTFLTVGVYALLRGWKERRIRWLLLYTGTFLLAMFTKPVLYLLAFPHLIGLAWLAYSRKDYRIAVPAVIPVLAIFLYQSWNETRTGYAHFSSIQNLSLFQYTTYNLLAQEYGMDRATAMNDSLLEVMFTLPDYASQQELISTYSLSTLLNHPLSYLEMHTKGMINFLIDPGRFDLYHFLGLEEVGGKGLQRTFSEEGYAGIWRYIGTQPVTIGLLLGVILVGNLTRWTLSCLALFNRQIPLSMRISIALLMVYLIGITGTSGASRFSVPLFALSISLIMAGLTLKAHSTQT